MISLLEQTPDTRAVFFDTSGMIFKISNRVEEDNTNFAWFKVEDIKPFIVGEFKFSDYAVVRTSNPLLYEIKKKKIDLKTRNIDSNIVKIENSENPDLIVTVKDDTIIIEASKELIKKSNVSDGQVVKLAGNAYHPFFITHIDRPDFLISTEMIRFSELLSGEKVIIKYEYKYDVSVYTRKYFDNYSLRRE